MTKKFTADDFPPKRCALDLDPEALAEWANARQEKPEPVPANVIAVDFRRAKS